jgi:hypothetical protein
VKLLSETVSRSTQFNKFTTEGENNMRRIIRTACTGLLLCLLGSAAHGVNLIRNGSFESPGVPAGGYATFSTGQTFSGWSVAEASGNVGVVSGTFTQDGFSFPARSGKQWLDLTGLSQTATGVAQTVPTTPGAAYTLVFSVGNLVNPTGIFGVSSTVNVLVNGTHVFSATNSRGTGQTKIVWQKFTTTITATSSRTTISFVNGDPSGDTLNGIDAISLVPETDDVVGADGPPTSED